ncbi:hypothetical protein Poli38472_010714 [Pythium oligandrum]|uniref:tRNA nucleotidyltransferase n=1 Tax=Pythium oligandrum TaxID=41045 RepID=A0A8K1FGH3_PYTOL|nr:hypothetical protein Poli38472_010714 [Pythium oligandrum]|eukprot:TMW61651.1 hypothetical protein Poli38472_010714 [Pythium oligandrum]
MSSEHSAITLTPAESKLFDFLLYIRHLYAPTTQLRVAGGWVRDKLRGAESEDIDIVLDNIYGKQFANHITTFQRQRKLPMSSVGVVKANSDKSKHLEVAQVKINDLMVDFVHLRSEAYTDDSRIPEATFAAPTEDASRRDITINALFYNIHTQQVEDFTGQGLDDLANRVIRTPLAPVQTFLDDPLRVLRVIRFACEFGFSLDTEILDAMHTHDSIRDAMKRKVSRERIGIEVRKMLSGSDPSRAVGLLADFELLEIVFDHEQSEQPPSTPTPLRDTIVWTPEQMEQSHKHVQYLQQTRQAIDRHQISYVESTAAMLAPFFLPSGRVQELSTGLESFVSTSSTWMEKVDDETIIEISMQFLQQREQVLREFPKEELIELLKISVKWPKPVAKRVALTLEAILAFPSTISTQDGVQNHIQLFLWSRRYHDVLAIAIPTLLTNLEPEEDREKLVMALHALTQRFIQQSESDKRRKLDGKVVRDSLGGQAGPAISHALELLSVWELVHPEGSRAQELEFLDRLRLVLT